MMKELKFDDPYEISPGCPTVTFDLGDESLMVPYSSFISGLFKDGQITLNFQEWGIMLEGSQLCEVWKFFQLQDIKEIRKSGAGGNQKSGHCHISAMKRFTVIKNE